MSSYSLVWHSKPSGGIVTAFPSSFYIGLENSPDHKLVAICLPVCGMPRWRSGKGSACQCRRHRRSGFDPWVWKSHWRRKWQPTPVYLPRESHGQRNLAGYSPWGCKELELSEQLSMHAQSYSNQNSVVLAQKQTYGSVQQDREPRNKPTHLTSINV